jgi:hypothetical protein
LLWQAIGYNRRALFFISPRLFAQSDFFNDLNFRKGRDVVQDSKRAIKLK